MPVQSPNHLHCQKWAPYKVRVAFSKPICATKARIGPSSANQNVSTASHISHHVHFTLWVTPPTFSSPTHSTDAATDAQSASYSGSFEKSEKRTWYPLFVHPLNFPTFREFRIILLIIPWYLRVPWRCMCTLPHIYPYTGYLCARHGFCRVICLTATLRQSNLEVKQQC